MRGAKMRRPKMRFEQVPVELVEKIATEFPEAREPANGVEGLARLRRAPHRGSATGTNAIDGPE